MSGGAHRKSCHTAFVNALRETLGLGPIPETGRCDARALNTIAMNQKDLRFLQNLARHEGSGNYRRVNKQRLEIA